MSDNQSPYPPTGYEAPPAAPLPAAPPRKTSGLAIAGFILAILIAPIGFILSIIALITAGRSGKKGKGLAIAGIVISLLISGGATAIGIALANSNIATVADPGCIKGRSVILSSTRAPDSADVEANRKALQGTIDGLKNAAAQAKNASVRDAMTALADDYSRLLDAASAGSGVDDILAQVGADGQAIDKLCSLGN
jgi:hypothetical protein